jgi:hypothetical protein
MVTTPRIDLRSGVTEPVILTISQRQVEASDIASVVTNLKRLMATREDAWLYRDQTALAVDGYNHDPRELVDIPEVRALLRELYQQWYWAFFFDQVDDSLKIPRSCVCETRFPGGGAVEIDGHKVEDFLICGFARMSAVLEKHGFPEAELESMSRGLVELIEQAGLA